MAEKINNNKTIRTLQIRVAENMGKYPRSENIWNVAENHEDIVLKMLIFYSTDLLLSAPSQG